MKLIRQVDYFLIILIGYIGIIGTVGACELEQITIGQCLMQSGIAFLLCYIIGKWGFTEIVRIIKWRRKCRQARRIFYHGSIR